MMPGIFIPRSVVLALAMIFANSDQTFAHGVQEHRKDITPGDSIAGLMAPAAVTGTMGFEEKPGNAIPLDLSFVDDKADSVALREIIDRPTILAFLYYRCPNACNLLLTSIAQGVRSFGDPPKKAPNVVIISINEDETPNDAKKARSVAFEVMHNKYPADRWHFLTGSKESIRKATDAAGFRFVKKGADFDHPMGIIILSPNGKVMRYILGTDYLPMDISLSLMEASSNTLQPTIARVMRACFSYDPKSHRFVFNILRVSATVILGLLGIFIVYLILGKKLRKKRS